MGRSWDAGLCGYTSYAWPSCGPGGAWSCASAPNVAMTRHAASISYVFYRLNCILNMCVLSISTCGYAKKKNQLNMVRGQKQNDTAESVLSQRSAGGVTTRSLWGCLAGASSEHLGTRAVPSARNRGLGQLPDVGRSQTKLIRPSPDRGSGGREEREPRRLRLS